MEFALRIESGKALSGNSFSQILDGTISLIRAGPDAQANAPLLFIASSAGNGPLRGWAEDPENDGIEARIRAVGAKA